jgi:hypothetical protein
MFFPDPVLILYLISVPDPLNMLFKT